MSHISNESLNFSGDDDAASQSSTSSRATIKNARITIRRLGKKKDLNEGEIRRLSSAKVLVETYERQKSSFTGSSSVTMQSENGSLLEAMNEVEVNADDISDADADSAIFRKVMEALQLSKKLGAKNVNELNENDRRRLEKAQEIIQRWSQAKLDLGLSDKQEGKFEQHFEGNNLTNSVLERKEGIVNSANLDISSLQSTSKGLTSLARNPAEGGRGLPAPVDDGSFNPDSEEHGCNKRDRSHDTISPNIGGVKRSKEKGMISEDYETRTLHRDGVGESLTLAASSPLPSSKGLPSIARILAREGKGSTAPVDNGSLNPESEEHGGSKRCGNNDICPSGVTLAKVQRVDRGNNVYNRGGTGVAIVDEGSSDRRIREDNWRLLESKLLFRVSDMVRDGTGPTPFFGNIQTRNGHKILYCKTDETLNWLKATIAGLDGLWEGARLKVVSEDEVPRQPKIRIFVTGPILPKERLLGILRAQNSQTYPSADWQILKMDQPTDSGRSVMLAVNHETLEKLESNGFRVSVGISSAIARPVLEAEERARATTVSQND